MSQGAFAQLDGGQFLADLYQKDPIQAAFIQKVINAVNHLGVNLGANPVGDVKPPDPIASVNVKTSGEYMHVSLTHTAPVKKGINYFVEVDTNPNFPQPQVKPLGPSRASLPFVLPSLDDNGNQVNYYVRAFAQYPGSKPSKVTVFGGAGNPTAIKMGGSTKLSLLPSTGSGTSSVTGQQGASGFGRVLNSPAPSGLVQSSIAPVTNQGQSSQQATTLPVPTGDGLVHGPGPWETDPAFVMWREDFLPSINTAGNNTGTNSLTWSQVGQAANGGVLYSTGAPPNIGIITWAPNTTVGFQGPGTMLTLTPWSSGTGSWQSMPLLDYPSWKATFIFKVEECGVNTNAFNMTHKSLYVGFCGTMDHYNTIDLGQSTRPRTFYGVRCDASPGLIAMGGGAIASTFQAGMVTYTITGGGTYAANGSYAGQMITITGYTNPNNNGTFLCTGSTASALLISNPSAVTGSGAGFTGTMTTPAGPNDSGYVFECTNGIPVAAIASANYRNYLPELTFATGITPTKGRWVRLDMTLTVAGQLTMTLVDGVSTATHTFSIQQQVVPLNLGSNETAGQVGSITTFSDGWTQCALGNISGTLNAAVTTFDCHTCGYCSVGDTGGNMVTFAGLTGALSRMNGTWGPTFYNNSAQTINFPTSLSALAAQTPNAGSTFAFYPSLTPFFGFGWDDSNNNAQVNTASIYVDYFALCWNPGLNPANALTANPLKARYF